jgi:hypothetical protein
MPLAVVGYALLGTSRHLFVGPSATVATLSASTVAVDATASTGSTVARHPLGVLDIGAALAAVSAP